MAKAKPKRRMRGDSLVNAVTGLGQGGRDKRLEGEWQPDQVSQEELENIYRSSSMAAHVIEVPVLEEFRRGWDIRIGDDDEADDAGREIAEDAQNLLEERGFVERLQEARIWSRAYGGAGLLIGADDGQELSEELNEARIQTFTSLTVFSPEELRPVAWDKDVASPRYGEPILYEIYPLVDNLTSSNAQGGLPRNVAKLVNATLGNEDIIQVHYTRIVRFDGVKVSRRQLRSTEALGWGDSILVRSSELVRDYKATWQAVALMLQDFAQARLKIKNLAEMVTDENATKNLFNRMAAVQASRSKANMVILDAEEDFTYDSPGVAGLSDLLQQLAIAMAAELRIPVTLLMGQSPAGLNATGDADVRNFYANVAAEQKRSLLPALNRVLRLLFLSKDGPSKGAEPDSWQVHFRPLWQPTDAEVADLRLKMAQADVAYIGAGVLSAEEVAVNRFGGAQYSTETYIDTATRDDITPPASDEPTPEELAAQAAIKAGGIGATGGGRPVAQAAKQDKGE